jgi:hypothetical protein
VGFASDWRLLRELLADNVAAMLAGSPYREHRREWLRRFHRRTPFRDVDAWLDARWEMAPEASSLRTQLREDLLGLSRSYGVAPWHVELSLFVKGYSFDAGVPGGTALALTFRVPRGGVALGRPSGGRALALREALDGTGLFVELGGGAESGEPKMVLEFPVWYPSEAAASDTRIGLTTLRRAFHGVALDAGRRGGQSSPAQIATTTLVCDTDEGLAAPEGLEEACLARGVDSREAVTEPIDELRVFAARAMDQLFIRFDVPQTLTAHEAVQEVRAGIQRSRTALNDVGIRVGRRIRLAWTAKLARSLLVDGSRLPPRALGDLTLDLFGGEAFHDSLRGGRGKKVRSSLKSLRNQARDHLRRKGLLPPGS